jgi:hypothetical protein
MPQGPTLYGVYINDAPKHLVFWCECWNIKINEEKTRGIYFSHRHGPLKSHLTPNGQNIPFVNSIKYLGVIFGRRITWRLHI